MPEENPLYLRRLLLGQMANYVYLIGCKKTRECWVVDPVWELDEILRQVAGRCGRNTDRGQPFLIIVAIGLTPE